MSAAVTMRAVADTLQAAMGPGHESNILFERLRKLEAEDWPKAATA